MNAPTYINAAHEVLAKSGEALCVAEVAKAAGIPKQSATKLLRELSGLGMIEPEPRAGGVPFYRLIVAPASEINDVAEVGDTDVVELKRLKDVAALKSERDDLRARLDAVTQQSIADTAALTHKNERLHEELEAIRAELATARAEAIALKTLEGAMPGFGAEYDAQRIASLTAELQALRTSSANAINEADRLRAELATELQAREALQEQAGDDAVDVKDAAVGYLVRVPKRTPILRRKPESARSAALSAVRAGAARAEVLAVVPVGTARRGAEWRGA